MLKEYTIDSDIVQQLIDLLAVLKDQNEIVNHEVDSVNAFQTNNLCYDNRANELIYKILRGIGLDEKYYYSWFHMIDYDTHGHQRPHNHQRSEDMSYILYLTDCEKGGETVFVLNGQETKVFPVKGKLVLFDSILWHYANPTVEKKKVAVGALREY